MNKKIMSLVLSLGLVFGMGSAAFAETNPTVVNLLPYPNTQEFNKIVKYTPSEGGSTFLRVQGADANYLPLNFASTNDAKGVSFTAYDGLNIVNKNVRTGVNGVTYVSSKIGIPTNLSYGPKFVKATLGNYTPGSWTGMIDLGVILNPTSNVSASGVNVYYFNGTPTANNRLKKVLNLNITQNLVPSSIKYASALDAAKAGNSNTTLANPNTINVYAKSMTINGTTYTASGNIGWQYRVYDSQGHALKNCDKAGAEVFPVSNGAHVVWAYGSWGILGNTIDTALLQ